MSTTSLRFWVALACLGLLFAPAGPARAAARVATATAPSAPAKTPDAQVLDALPMAFEPNVGQVDPRVKFVARGSGYTTFLTDAAAVLSLAAPARESRAKGESLRLHIVGARDGADLVGERPLPGVNNYLVGEHEAWRRSVPTFEAVRYENVYDGVDARFYGANGRLEYDFVVRPGADVSQVRIRFEGQSGAEIDEAGDLILRLANGQMRQRRAVAYQQTLTGKRRVAGQYTLGADGDVRLAVGEYDRTRDLVIDPVLIYDDFLGGSQSYDSARGVALDASGATYVLGFTDATDFPTTPGAYDRTLSELGPFPVDTHDLTVSKLDANGALVYSTYVGGSSYDYGYDIAVDASGGAFFVGNTYSADFPTTPGAVDASFGGANEAFAARLSADGSTLVYSTYLGGSLDDTARGVAVDATGAAYVTGWTASENFPTTTGAFSQSLRGPSDAFVTKLNGSGSALVYSTYLGGDSFDQGRAIGVDGSGSAHMTGTTSSANFPMAAHGYDLALGGASDAFVTSLNAAGSAIATSTFLGGTAGEEEGTAIVVRSSGQAYVAGNTTSNNFPTTLFAFGRTAHGSMEGFVTSLAANAVTLNYSSYLGGAGDEEVFGLAVDGAGSAYVVGDTRSIDFPATPGAIDGEYAGQPQDGFVTKVSPNGSTITYSTFLGGSSYDTVYDVAVDAPGGARIVGDTSSISFPTTPAAFDPTFNGSYDAFVARLDAEGAGLVFSTFLSGSTSRHGQLEDTASAVAADATGAAYVTGSTQSINFPTTPGTYDPVFTGSNVNNGRDCFVTKLAPDGRSIVWSTFFGSGSAASGVGIAVDPAGFVFVAGRGYVPTTPGAYQTTLFGLNAVFVTKFTPDGSGLVYSTYLGGGYASTVPSGLAIDSSGSAYVVGITTANDFPTTAGAFDTTFSGAQYGDSFITKFNPSGSALVYSSFIGGDSQGATAYGVAVDGSGAAYVTGYTGSADFPTTSGAFSTTIGGQVDAFVLKVAPNGSLAYSTFLGGASNGESDIGRAIAVDASGAAYVTGSTGSRDFPTTPGVFQTVAFDSPNGDAFVTKLSPNGGSLVYSTYLSAGNQEIGAGIAVDSMGAAYVVGQTNSVDYPTTPDAYDVTPTEFFNDSPFLSKLSPVGDALTYSTFFGSGRANAVALDASGAAYVAGDRTDVETPPIGFGVRDSKNAFVAKLSLPVAGTRATDTPGVYVVSSGAWFLRNSSTPGGADLTFGYGGGGPGVVAITGDWDGDGDDTAGLYAPATGAFFLRNANSGGVADVVFTFGGGGALVPLVGDWNADGVDTVGLYDPATGAVFLRNSNTPGAADVVFTFGGGGAGIAPLTGDWNGDGADTIGLYVASTGTFFLRNANGSGAADLAFSYGPAGSRAVVGDWNGDGIDTVGVYVAGTGSWFLRDANTPGVATTTFTYGPANSVPLTGDWDGL